MKNWLDSIRIGMARLILPEGMHVQRNGGGPRKPKEATTEKEEL
jgi:hypothetical protein